MRVFLTGATGVIGRRAIPALLEAGHHVSAVARSDAKAAQVAATGATAARVSLFDAEQVAQAVQGHDAVVHLATNIPTGASAGLKRGWRTNDRLRKEASATLAAAANAAGIERYVGESTTFPYLPGGTDWITEDHPRDYFFGNQTCLDSEAAAQLVTNAGGQGVVLRFAMFYANDSAHIDTFMLAAKRGFSAVTGHEDTYVSFIDMEDAAAAVVAALEAPAGVYNVAEPNPVKRAEHNTALAKAVGRDKLRPLPGLMQKAGGAGLESVSRAQRISSAKLQEITSWAPAVPVVECW